MSRYSTITGVYEITPKPGLPQMAICHGFYVLDTFRGHGHGHKLMQSLIQSLRLEHFDQAICTTAGDNLAMQACLIKSGWGLLSVFTNSKTGAPHQVWGLEVRHG